MKPAPFQLHRPRSVDDVVALLAQLGDDAKLLAGGQSLVPLLAMRLARVDHLIDLNDVVGLDTIVLDGDELVIGSGVRQADTAGHPLVREHAPLVARAIPLIGHFQIRNRGTIGGSLSHADPASELPAVALALDAAFTVKSGRGTRRVPATEFFVDRWVTALADDELLTEVRIPRRGARSGYAIDEVARRSGDFAMVGVTCALSADATDHVAAPRIALFGVAATPVRALEAERAINGGSVSEWSNRLSELGRLARESIDPPDDVHATAAYRRDAGALLVARAVGQALQEATHAE